MKSLLASELTFILLIGLGLSAVLSVACKLTLGIFPWQAAYPVVTCMVGVIACLMMAWFGHEMKTTKADPLTHFLYDYKLSRPSIDSTSFNVAGSNLYVVNYFKGMMDNSSETPYSDMEIRDIAELINKFGQDEDFARYVRSKGAWVLSRRTDGSACVFYNDGKGGQLAKANEQVANAFKGLGSAMSSAMQGFHNIHEFGSNPTPYEPYNTGSRTAEFPEKAVGYTFNNEEFNAGRRKGYSEGKAKREELESTLAEKEKEILWLKNKVKREKEYRESAYCRGQKNILDSMPAISAERFNEGVENGKNWMLFTLLKEQEGKPDYQLLPRLKSLASGLKEQGISLELINELIKYVNTQKADSGTPITTVPTPEERETP